MEEKEFDGMVVRLSDNPEFLKPVFTNTIRIMKVLSRTNLTLALLHLIGAIVVFILLCIYGGWILSGLFLGLCVLTVVYTSIFARTTVIEGESCDEEGNAIGESVYIIHKNTIPAFSEIHYYVMCSFHSPEFDAQVKEYTEKLAKELKEIETN